ncbi:MAG: hypothetical protein EON58_08155 [Alphaproteobacteria bacterium]|nr:MAG: hypothetical protein EON58_08155 [Alphaproteobacteria bacterium]
MHHNSLRLSGTLLAFFACACSTSSDRFLVEDGQKLVASAKVVICGAETVMSRNGANLLASHPITCEGSGVVRLTYKNGAIHDCHVGYVSSFQQNWRFRTMATGCETVLDPRTTASASVGAGAPDE